MSKRIGLKYAHRLLANQIILVTSFYKDRPNVLTVAWNMPVDYDPPKVAVVIGDDNYSFECISKTGEFVINIPPHSMMEKVLACGSVSGRDVDKFKKFDIETYPAHKVRPPIIKDALASLECRLIDRALIKTYNIFIGEVVYAEAKEGIFTDHWILNKPSKRNVYHLGGRNFAVLKSLVNR